MRGTEIFTSTPVLVTKNARLTRSIEKTLLHVIELMRWLCQGGTETYI